MTTIHAIIPAFNESKSIATVVRGARKNVDFCVVIDDGSRDKTARLARKAGAIVIHLSERTGTGNATKTGLQYAVEHGGSIVCLLDADGQHDPRYIPSLIAEVVSGADLVIGSRYCRVTRDVSSLLRRWGSRIISFMIWAVYKKRIYDPTSGFRAMNHRTLEHLVDRYPDFFPEPEVVIDLINQGFVIKEVSVEMKPRMYGKSSIGVIQAICLFMYISKKIINDLIVTIWD